MKINEIKEIARQHGLKMGKASKSELVRAIQCAEGNPPCFNSNSSAGCMQLNCLWRSDCE
jgi:hypothetical protein